MPSTSSASACADPAPAGLPKALLFDLGRVVIRLDMDRTFAIWAAAAGVPTKVLAGRYAHCEHYEAHERGEIEASTWYAALRERLGVELDDATFERGWKALLSDVEPSVVAAIRRLKGFLPIHLFTNTNVTHRRLLDESYGDTMALFDQVFDSSRLGLRKPDPAAFEQVVKTIGLPASDILFLDDLAANVAGARTAGLRAVQVTTADDVVAALGPLLRAADA